MLSGGDGGNTPVDFVVNYRPPQSFLIGSTDAAVDRMETARDEKPRTISVIDQALRTQSEIATPDWVGGLAKSEKNPDGKAVGNRWWQLLATYAKRETRCWSRTR